MRALIEELVLWQKATKTLPPIDRLKKGTGTVAALLFFCEFRCISAPYGPLPSTELGPKSAFRLRYRVQKGRKHEGWKDEYEHKDRERDGPSREYTERVNSRGTESVGRALAVLHPLTLPSHQTNTVTSALKAQAHTNTQIHKHTATHTYTGSHTQQCTSPTWQRKLMFQASGVLKCKSVSILHNG